MPIAKSRLEILQIRKLLQCVNEKDENQIYKLLENGVENLINYNEPDEGKTCLILAATENDHKTIKLLLDNGAHPDVVDFKGRSAPMIAAQYGHYDSLELLTKYGADLTICDLSGKSVLFYCIASTQRHIDCLRLMLSNNVDINSVAKDGKTVLIAACETADDNEEICLMLLDNEPDVDIKQAATGKTALMAACGASKSFRSSAPVVSRCLKLGAKPDELDRHGKCAAHYAAKAGNFRGLVALAAFRAQFDVYDDTQSNPIHYASKSNGATCKYLGQRGCNPKVKNAAGELPRVIAKEAGAKDCLKELRKVEKSFGKHGKNNEPWALALYDWSVENDLTEQLKELDPESTGIVNKKEFRELLEKNGAPLTEEIDNKVLPLYDKERNGNFDYKDFLTGKKYINKLYLMSAFESKKKKKKKGGKGGRKKKAKIPFEIPVMPSSDVMRPFDGGPPIMYIPRELHATDLNRYSNEKKPANEIEDDCIWYMGDPNRQFINMNDAAKHGDLDSIKLALSRGYSVDTRDRFYKTPLMSAARYGNLDMCMALIGFGADVKAKDNLHWTALHHAAHCGMIDMIELLLNSGAELEAKGLNGGTALFRAIETSRYNVVDFLLKKGAKIQVENKKGATPMDLAYFWADPRVIEAVRIKADALPPIKDKKGRGSAKKGSAKAGTSRTQKKAAPKEIEPEVGLPQRSASEIALKKAGNTLSRFTNGAALSSSDLTGNQIEDVRFTPRQLQLTNQSGRISLEDARQIKLQTRQRFGWEVDFPDQFNSMFHQNLMSRVGAMEAAQ